MCVKSHYSIWHQIVLPLTSQKGQWWSGWQQAKFWHHSQNVNRPILAEKFEQLPPMLNFMAYWKNSDARSVSLTLFLPFSNLNTFLVFDKIIRIIFLIMSKNVEWDRGTFSVHSLPSARWLQAVSSIVGCKQPLLHKLTAFLSHLLTARLQNSLPALICANNFENIIDTT